MAVETRQFPRGSRVLGAYLVLQGIAFDWSFYSYSQPLMRIPANQNATIYLVNAGVFLLGALTVGMGAVMVAAKSRARWMQWSFTVLCILGLIVTGLAFAERASNNHRIVFLELAFSYLFGYVTALFATWKPTAAASQPTV